MSALWVEKGPWAKCGNGCIGGGTYKQGRTRMHLIGRPLIGPKGTNTYCDKCAKELVQAYDGAL
jgi:hypothetical protein